MHNATRQPGLM